MNLYTTAAVIKEVREEFSDFYSPKTKRAMWDLAIETMCDNLANVWEKEDSSFSRELFYKLAGCEEIAK